MLDPVTLEVVGRSVRLEHPVCCVSAGPDNHTAVALVGDFHPTGFYRAPSTRWALVDLASGTVLDEGAPAVNGRVVAYSPDGWHAAIGGTKGEVVVMDLDTGEPIGPPVVGHDEGVRTLTYSPDGQLFLTGGHDSSVGLWDGATGRLVSRVVTPGRPNEAAFGEDQISVLIATEGGGAVHEWDTNVQSALDFACRAAGRDLSDAEWTEQFGDRPRQPVCPR
jgi:WD40 repeat protein